MTLVAARQALDLATDAAGKATLRIGIHQLDQAVSLRKRKRFQKHGVNHGKDGGIRPMPSAKAEIAVAVNPGLRRSIRKACFRSLVSVSIVFLPPRCEPRLFPTAPRTPYRRSWTIEPMWLRRRIPHLCSVVSRIWI